MVRSKDALLGKRIPTGLIITVILLTAGCGQDPAFIETTTDADPNSNYPNGQASQNSDDANPDSSQSVQGSDSLDPDSSGGDNGNGDGSGSGDSSGNSGAGNSGSGGSGGNTATSEGGGGSSAGNGSGGGTGENGGSTGYISGTQGSHLSLSFPLTGEVATDSEEVVTHETQPVQIYFAIDVTGSMSWVIDTIKNNIIAFSDRLASRSLSYKLGAIAFRDSIASEFPLSSDVTSFKSFVSGLSAAGGGDTNEASLLAIERAIELFEQGGSIAATKIIFVVTDNPGHYGPTPRDCSLTGVRSRFSAMPVNLKSQTKLFYSVPNAGAACSGFATARAQMDQLLATMFSDDFPIEIRGGALPFPFDGDTLVDQFVEEIVRVTSTTIDLGCYVSDAVLKGQRPGSAPVSLGEWHATSNRNAINLALSGSPLEIHRAVLDDEDWIYSATFSLEVSRCCVTDEVAHDSGPVPECRKSLSSSVGGIEVNFYD